ncbi:MAG: hypothetical protein K2O65_05875 [Lachnospiraceae bacterium]|nr:hypothetical protein [Lachnospiraceae bacterium]
MQEDISENVNDDIYPNIKREIVSFTELPDEIKEQAVEVGTPVAGLELPDTLTALCRISNEENPDSGTDSDKEQDSEKDDKQPDEGEKERPEEDSDRENENESDDSDQESGSDSEDSDNENGDDFGNSGNEGAEKPEDSDKDNGETTEGSTDEENGEAAEEGTHEGNGETFEDSAGNADDAEGESGGGNAESTVEAIKEGIRAAADNNKAIEIQKTVTVKMRENYAMPHVVSEIKELSYEAASAVSDIESEESSNGLGEVSEADKGNGEADEKITDEMPQEAEAGAEIENGTKDETGNEVETEKEIGIKEETVTIDVITWESTPEYDSELEGVYIFTPVISDGEYTLAEDVWLPEISVTVADVEMMLEEEELPDVSGSTEPMCGVISRDTTWEAGGLRGGTLIVEPGVTLTINGAINLHENVTIKGGGTILKGSKDAYFNISRYTKVTVSNITIDGANISSIRSMICVPSEAHLEINDGSVIRNCIIQVENFGEGGDGGAIWASNSSSVFLTDMSISDCHALGITRGGAVAMYSNGAAVQI